MTDRIPPLPVVQAEVDAALATFNGGLVRQDDERNDRGYTTYYHPEDSMRSVLENFAAARLASQAPLLAQLEEKEAKLRMIVSHATGGATSDTSLSTNEIAVRITQKVNQVWKHAQEDAQAQLEELRKALQELADLMDDVTDGNYTPDSFTTQPARILLAKIDTPKGAHPMTDKPIPLPVDAYLAAKPGERLKAYGLAELGEAPASPKVSIPDVEAVAMDAADRLERWSKLAAKGGGLDQAAALMAEDAQIIRDRLAMPQGDQVREALELGRLATLGRKPDQ